MKKVRMQEAALFLSLMSKSDSRSKRIRYLQNLILHHFRMPFIKRGSPAGSLMQKITEMRAGIWLCGERIRPSPPNRLSRQCPVMVPSLHSPLESCSPPPRSEVLFKPVVGIRLVVEGFYLLVAAVSVQLDGFSEGAVRFQVKDSDPRFPRGSLHRL